MLVQNTGAVLSIAFVLAVVTSSVPTNVLFSVFSGLANHISNAQLDPFISNMHTALWCLSAISLLGAFVAAARPNTSRTRARLPRTCRGPHRSCRRHERRRRPTLRIGEVAELTGTTPRTIRYYEEIGLLPERDRAQGKHRSYTEADVERVRRSFGFATCWGSRSSSCRSCWRPRARVPNSGASTADRGRRGTEADPRRALGHIAAQLELVRERRRELEQLERELGDKRRLKAAWRIK